MKLLKLILLALCLGFLTDAGAQTRKMLEFATREYNLDSLRFDSDSLVLDYGCENVSGRRLTVLEVHSYCGCFTGEILKRSLAPGEKTVVRAVFRPFTLHGPQNRSLTVIVTDGQVQTENSLSVKAFVTRDQSEGEIRFPEHLGCGIRTDALTYLLKKDREGDYVFSFPLYNDTDQPVRIGIEGPSRLKIYAPETIPPRSRKEVRCIYGHAWLIRGAALSGKLRIRADDRELSPVTFEGKLL